MSGLALDRQDIAKKDFPISRRGYEPEAVDLHLEALAGEVDRLQHDLGGAQRAAESAGAPPPPPAPSGTQSLALAASEQVRMIVEAAETSAADIERSAQEQAARIRSDADSEARRTRDEAVARSQDHVGYVSEATSTMLQRVDSMESELEALIESLRTGTNRLTADLSLLQGNLGDLYGAAGSTQSPEPPSQEPAPREEPAAPEAVPAAVVSPPQVEDEPSYSDEPVDEPAAHQPDADEPSGDAPSLEELERRDDRGSLRDDGPAEELDEPPLEEELDEEPMAVAPAMTAAVPEPAAHEPERSERRQSDGDVEGARLIALNMALNGQSREETNTYLRDNFDLDDRDTLLDEVYATVEG